jgi:TolB-like protein/tetratricopeptide (TPR) repeat protein
VPAILPNYEYDIFISYRQNDNKPATAGGRDGWVTSFVAALKDELEATQKNPVSIYFDENPHDGLLETHQVNASLEKKLKCLVFIPIISQTYCDTSSFAWEHEFLPFIKMAKADELGMNITLANDNVASRVLPVKIHDLDSGDQSILEQELGGPIRSIDFIYKEPGVNRSLKPSDDRNLNLQKSDYHNQINKVANALKEIGSSLIENSGKSKDSRPQQAGSKTIITSRPKNKLSLKKILGLLIIPLVMALAYYFFLDNTNGQAPSPILGKSIAVLAFDDMSENGDQEYFCDGISEEIINNLAQIKELKVIGRSSSFQFKGKNPDHREIGEKLNVATYIEGSIRKSGNKIRITAQLINVPDGSHIWSETYSRDLTDIFEIQDEISSAIANQLKVSFGLSKTKPVDIEVYETYLKARTLLNQRGPGVEQSLALFEEIIAIDSTYQPAWTGLSLAWLLRPIYSSSNPYLVINYDKEYGYILDNVERAVNRAMQLDPNNAETLSMLATLHRQRGQWKEANINYEKALLLNDQSTLILEDYVQFLVQMGYAKKAMPYAQKMIDLDPLTPIYLLVYSVALYENGRIAESLQTLKKGISLNHNFKDFVLFLTYAYLNSGQLDSAVYALNKYNFPEPAKTDILRQIEAVKQGNTHFDFDIDYPLLFALNELYKLDDFFSLSVIDLTTEFYLGLAPVYAPQSLTLHSERFTSDPRMKEVIRNLKLVEFWQEFGWPDRVRPVGEDDFEILTY